MPSCDRRGVGGRAGRADLVTCSAMSASRKRWKPGNAVCAAEAEKQAPDVKVFFLKDANPSKPNRWLALPRSHRAVHSILMSDEERADLLAAAVQKRKSCLAMSGPSRTTRPACRRSATIHLHIGKLIPGSGNDQFFTATKVEDIPAPPKGEGFWIHPQGNLFHVHTGEQVTETVLER